MVIIYVLYLAVLYIFIFCIFFFFKQKTAYEMRISDWSSDVCSSDLLLMLVLVLQVLDLLGESGDILARQGNGQMQLLYYVSLRTPQLVARFLPYSRSEEHTSELQSLMRISYAVFCLKKKQTKHECLSKNNIQQ